MQVKLHIFLKRKLDLWVEQLKGVRGIKLDKDQYVISLIIPEEEASIFTVSENGSVKDQSL